MEKYKEVNKTYVQFLTIISILKAFAALFSVYICLTRILFVVNDINPFKTDLDKNENLCKVHQWYSGEPQGQQNHRWD